MKTSSNGLWWQQARSNWERSKTISQMLSHACVDCSSLCGKYLLVRWSNRIVLTNDHLYRVIRVSSSLLHSIGRQRRPAKQSKAYAIRTLDKASWVFSLDWAHSSGAYLVCHRRPSHRRPGKHPITTNGCQLASHCPFVCLFIRRSCSHASSSSIRI